MGVASELGSAHNYTTQHRKCRAIVCIALAQGSYAVTASNPYSPPYEL